MCFQFKLPPEDPHQDRLAQARDELCRDLIGLAAEWAGLYLHGLSMTEARQFVRMETERLAYIARLREAGI